ncbi:SAP30-binding protein [Adelges cooleyi]|uniref:SAP30-binding protein n=1 Tax=Adelges cooleyi TaxID=133065 RepID=UPI0021807850|nr:SAP30-binding protein [Adelges cooleyi]
MSALASLTANYTDSEDEGTTPNQRRQSEEIPNPNLSEERLPSPKLQIPNSAPAVTNPEDDNKTNLVSYFEEHDIVMSDEEIDHRQSIDEQDILPPEPPGRCSKELQEKIARLHEKMGKDGMDMNYLIQKRKDFRNPSIYEKLLQFCNINELGTNYPPHLYDPLRWGKESFYEELGRLQKEDMEKRQKERKEKTKVEVVSGTKKPNNSVTTSHKPEDKKSKWDLTTSATGTKGTIISAFGSLPKKQKLDIH